MPTGACSVLAVRWISLRGHEATKRGRNEIQIVSDYSRFSRYDKTNSKDSSAHVFFKVFDFCDSKISKIICCLSALGTPYFFEVVLQSQGQTYGFGGHVHFH